MKYTSYLLKTNFIKIENLEFKNIYLRIPGLLLGIAVVPFGIVTIMGLLPMTVIIDIERYVKLKYLKYQRHEVK